MTKQEFDTAFNNYELDAAFSQYQLDNCPDKVTWEMFEEEMVTE